MFSSSFFFRRCDFNFTCYNISHIVARHGFVQIFLHGHDSFADAFNSPRPCAGQPGMPRSAQPNPTGGGRD